MKTRIIFLSFLAWGSILLGVSFQDLKTKIKLSDNTLDLRGLNLTDLDGFGKDISRFSHLELDSVTVIDLSDNDLVELPYAIFRFFPNLETLILSHNELLKFDPGVLFGLNKLRHLYLSDNQLRELSSDVFYDVPLLEILELKNNFLVTRPDTSQLKYLKVLTLDGNPVTQKEEEEDRAIEKARKETNTSSEETVTSKKSPRKKHHTVSRTTKAKSKLV